jgi:hypothetical protein
MLPRAFGMNVHQEIVLRSANEAWVRGARAKCEMYDATDARRFETILGQLGRVRRGWEWSAVGHATTIVEATGDIRNLEYQKEPGMNVSCLTESTSGSCISLVHHAGHLRARYSTTPVGPRTR